MIEDKILIVTEANERVASGHLFECTVLTEYLNEQGLEATLMVNEDMPDELKRRIEIPFFTYQSDIQNEPVFLLDFLQQNAYQIILFNLREISNDFLKYIKQNVPIEIMCIDEFGNRRLDSDVIINPMIDDSYWKYETEAAVYCGEKYLVLPRGLQEYCKNDKLINREIKNITVSMGGVDLGNSTIRLAEWLPKIDSKAEINLVLGGGYQKESELRARIGDNERIRIFRNITYLSRLFFESDLAFCAGGNTLHELAVIGTPAIVIPSMPHEMKNGKAYEKKGFSLCGSFAADFTYRELNGLYQSIETEEVRKQMCLTGRRLADGKGYERIREIILRK